ncbi:APC family permease [Enterococcus sp. LJL99]
MSSKVDTSKSGYISIYALAMMNVAVVAGLGNDAQQAFYGLSSITLFAIGAIVFFIPTALVAAELAGGWTERGGIFRWVGEGMGKGFAFACLLILWFQTTFNLGAGMPSFAATIGFFTPDYDWAVKFAKSPAYELVIMCGFLLVFWFVTWLATRGTKVFSSVTKYGVTIGTLIPLGTIVILTIIWLCQGHHPVIAINAKGLLPKWQGMSTLALAAGVFFSYAGIDLNAAHIKQLKNPRRSFPIAMLIAGILAFLIFVVGTIIIAIIIPEKNINVIYALYTLYHTLGETIGAPWLYMVFVYVGFFATLAMWITNLAGPSFMLGQAGRSGFLPKSLQNNNKHGMPSRMLYLQAICVTVIAFVVKLLPNVEGFFIMITQTVTILYLLYYVLMFTSFIKLRYTQPNRPRSFTIPGGKFGAWVVTIVGLAACVFGIVLSIYPPAQVKSEVGSGTVYVSTILILVAIVLLVAFGMYQLSKKHPEWVDKDNKFAPFTWEIEGLKKPTKALSNVPTEMMSEGQNPMGMEIKQFYSADDLIVLPPEYQYGEAEKKLSAQAAKSVAGAAVTSVSNQNTATDQTSKLTTSSNSLNQKSTTTHTDASNNESKTGDS